MLANRQKRDIDQTKSGGEFKNKKADWIILQVKGR